MKKLMFLIFSLVVVNIEASDNVPQGTQEENIFVLFGYKDDTKNTLFAKFNVNDLRKSNFPEGPHRFNEIKDIDFKVIDYDLKEQLINDENAQELPLFCIEVSDEKGKHKACGFEVNAKGKLSYVFNLANELSDIRGVILPTEKFNEITGPRDPGDDDIDDATKTHKPNEKPIEPERYWITKKILQMKDWFRVKSEQTLIYFVLKIFDDKKS